MMGEKMRIDSAFVKEMAYALGADLCGIAPVDRFTGVPVGHHPLDLLPGCRSVIVMACEWPSDAVDVTTIAYTQMRDSMAVKLNLLAERMAKQLSRIGLTTFCKKSMGSTRLEEDGRYRDLLSLKHAAMLAGLGKIGKNTLLINEQYGNMIWLSAVLTTEELEYDPLAAYEVCPVVCQRCIKACPVGALGGEMMKQQTCYGHAYQTVSGRIDSKEEIIVCNTCRIVCPYHLGIRSNSG